MTKAQAAYQAKYVTTAAGKATRARALLARQERAAARRAKIEQQQLCQKVAKQSLLVLGDIINNWTRRNKS